MKVLHKYIKNKKIHILVIKLLAKLAYRIYSPIYIFFVNKFVSTDKFLITFISSPDFSDNAKILSNYIDLNDVNQRYKIVWLVSTNHKKYTNTENISFIRAWGKYTGELTLEALYYVKKSRILFFTHGFPRITKNSDGFPLVVNLWHGCGYKQNSKYNKKKHDSNFDYVIVPGDVFIETKSDFFSVKKESVLPLGYPRYDDLLGNTDVNTKLRIKDGLNLVEDTTIIWMPTFRDYKSDEDKMATGLPIYSALDDLYNLDKYLDDIKTDLIIKLHKNIMSYNIPNDFNHIKIIDNTILEQHKLELYELLKYTDALITDYSSIGIDYLLIDKPIAFTLDDFDKYQEYRGFVFENPLEYMPGHHIYKNTDFIRFLHEVSIGKDNYKKIRQIVKNKTHKYEREFCRRIVSRFDIKFD